MAYSTKVRVGRNTKIAPLLIDAAALPIKNATHRRPGFRPGRIDAPERRGKKG
jgi:hypothetical protein